MTIRNTANFELRRTTQINTLVRTCIVATCLWVPAASAADHPLPGLYSVTVVVDHSTLPVPSRKFTNDQCITEEHFQEGPNSFTGRQQNQDMENCSMVEYTMEGGEVAMHMECKVEDGEVTFVGSGQYSDNDFVIGNTMTMKAMGMEMKMNTTTTGKRSGDC